MSKDVETRTIEEISKEIEILLTKSSNSVLEMKNIIYFVNYNKKPIANYYIGGKQKWVKL